MKHLAWVPRTGPWFLTYRAAPGSFGVMISSSGPGVALSAAAFRRGFVVGWMNRRREFGDWRFILGSSR
jgi:hypothetical protein